LPGFAPALNVITKKKKKKKRRKRKNGSNSQLPDAQWLGYGDESNTGGCFAGPVGRQICRTCRFFVDQTDKTDKCQELC
jgi:hypothetical protein